jgi:hypothetical protein
MHRLHILLALLNTLLMVPLVFGEKPATMDALQNDTLYLYYSNGAISLAQMPWREGYRQHVLYDLYGHATYHWQEPLGSKPAVLEFYANGAVNTIVMDAELLGGEHHQISKISVGSTNGPEWRVDTPDEQHSAEHAGVIHYYWHRNDQRWAKQEVVRCQPYPGNTEDERQEK